MPCSTGIPGRMMVSSSRWGYWLARQGGDHLALIVEDLEAEMNMITVPRMARIMRTTPAILRSLLKRNGVQPSQGRIYYSPLDVAGVIRNRLNAMGDERAQTIPSGGDWVLAAHPRPGRGGFVDHLTEDKVAEIEQRAEGLGQWLSCEETADLLGVTKQTLLNWRKARDQAEDQDKDRWPVHFASPERTSRIQTMEEREYEDFGVIRESYRDWKDRQTEHTPSSRRDPTTGEALERASGGRSPVVYDRNLVVSWVRRSMYSA